LSTASSRLSWGRQITDKTLEAVTTISNTGLSTITITPVTVRITSTARVEVPPTGEDKGASGSSGGLSLADQIALGVGIGIGLPAALAAIVTCVIQMGRR